ncbi:unnamed protein product [Orchesella dallaii]|uniref:Uncharacterized protein n=1 Tax=Orchesella dallaii TaxID=48710 RepID=A0ABP1RBR0_9HEXA
MALLRILVVFVAISTVIGCERNLSCYECLAQNCTYYSTRTGQFCSGEKQTGYTLKVKTKSRCLGVSDDETRIIRDVAPPDDTGHISSNFINESSEASIESSTFQFFQSVLEGSSNAPPTAASSYHDMIPMIPKHEESTTMNPSTSTAATSTTVSQADLVNMSTANPTSLTAPTIVDYDEDDDHEAGVDNVSSEQIIINHERGMLPLLH